MINLFFILPMSYPLLKAGILAMGLWALWRSFRVGVPRTVATYEAYLGLWASWLAVTIFVVGNPGQISVPLSMLLLLLVMRGIILNHSLKNFDTVFKCFLAIFSFITFDSIIQLTTNVDLFGRSLEYGFRITGPYPTTRLDTMMFPFIGMALFYTNFYSTTKLIRFICFSVCIVSIIMMILTATRSAVLMLLFSAFVSWICLLRPSDLYSRKAIAIAVAMFALGTSVYFMSSEIEQIEKLVSRSARILEAIVSGDANQLKHSDGRGQIWSRLIDHFSEYPEYFLIGVGYENGDQFIKIKGAHQIHLDIIFTSGFIGFSLFTGFIISFYKAHIAPCRIYPPVYRLQMFQITWFYSPFMLQNHLEDTITQAAIFSSLILIGMLHKSLKESLKEIPTSDFAKLKTLPSHRHPPDTTSTERAM